MSKHIEITDLNELDELTAEWSHDRGILTNGKTSTQILKLMSELGEMADNAIKGIDITDDIGDCAVVLCNISRLEGKTLGQCWSHAYNDIKDREGFLNENGTFIKESDPAYKQLKLELGDSKQPDPVIVDLYIQSMPYFGLNYEYNIEYKLDNENINTFKLITENTIRSEINASFNLFKGRTEEQLKAYLKTIGELDD